MILLSWLMKFWQVGPALLLALAAAGATWALNRKARELAEKRESKALAETLAKNHEVAQAEAAAVTDEAADAALDAAADVDATH